MKIPVATDKRYTIKNLEGKRKMKVSIVNGLSISDRIENLQTNSYRIYEDLSDENIRVYEEFKKQYISNLLIKEKVREWPENGYVIISQTGTGKSTWVTKTIGEILIEHQTRGLLITPRVALTMQYKLELAKLYCPELLEELTEKGLHRRHEYGVFDVYSFQELITISKECNVMGKRYEFVVLDEVHAFVGDAAFNPFTETIFRFLLMRVGAKAKRIYLTATPDIILTEIAEIEEEITPVPVPLKTTLGFNKSGIRLTVFRFERDYRYIVPAFFEDEEHILKILEKKPQDQKGLIFVKSKAQGARWEQRLGERRALYLDAENKQKERTEEFQNILKFQKMEQQFLIATRFMDVGVNLKDVELKVVVLFHFYPEDIVQMLGRKRISDGETVELYIKLPSAVEIRADLGKIKSSEEEARKNVRFFGSARYYSQFEHPFYVKQKENDYTLHANGFFMRFLAYRKRFLTECLKYESDRRTFVENLGKKLLSYLPGCSEPIFLDYLQENDEEIRKQVREKLEQWIDQELNRDYMGVLSDQLLEIFGEKRRLDQKGQISIGKINEQLKKYGLPYTIANQCKKGKKGVWKIERGISG